MAVGRVSGPQPFKLLQREQALAFVVGEEAAGLERARGLWGHRAGGPWSFSQGQPSPGKRGLCSFQRFMKGGLSSGAWGRRGS